MEEILAKVKVIIADQFAVEEDSISMETDFEGDLGADSVDLVGLVMEFEEEFNIGEIPEDDLVKLKTVGDAVRYINDNLK